MRGAGVLLAAKLGEELCRRAGQRPILGEILAGVLIGPSVLGLVDPDEILEAFSEQGVVFLLFVVGLAAGCRTCAPSAAPRCASACSA